MNAISSIRAFAVACDSFIVDRDSLFAAAQFLDRRIVEARQSIPILSNVLFAPGDDGTLRLYATDLDISAEFEIEAAWGSRAPGAFTVPAGTLADVLKKLPKGCQAEITVGDDGRIAIAAGRARHVLQSLPRDDMPIIKAVEPLAAFELDAAQLYSDLIRIKPAISREETRYYLNGMFTAIRDGELTFVATDGHRLSMIQRPAPDGSEAMEEMIIPRKALEALEALIKARPDAGPVLFFTAGGCARIMIEYAGARFVSKLIDGTFPDYTRVIPGAPSAVINIEPGELARHAGGIPKSGAAKDKALVLDMREGGIRAGSPRLSLPDGSETFAGSCSGSVNAAFVGEDLEIGFNPRYVESFIAIATGELRIGFGEQNGPTLWLDAGEPAWTGVLMPHKVLGPLPDESAPVIRYPAVIPAPGRAGDLFDVSPVGMNDKPRAATHEETLAYMVDYATRLGIETAGRLDDQPLEFVDGICRGMMVGKMLSPTRWEEREKPIDYSRIGAPIEKETVRIEAEYEPGAIFVTMPGFRQPPVTMELADESGAYGAATVLSVDRKGAIGFDKAAMVEFTGLQPIKAARVSKRKARAVAPAMPVPAAQAAPGDIELLAAICALVGDLCPGPINQGEPWIEALRLAAGDSNYGLDNVDGDISVINYGRKLYRTRIPARYQAIARQLWEEQTTTRDACFREANAIAVQDAPESAPSCPAPAGALGDSLPAPDALQAPAPAPARADSDPDPVSALPVDVLAALKALQDRVDALEAGKAPAAPAIVDDALQARLEALEAENASLRADNARLQEEAAIAAEARRAAKAQSVRFARRSDHLAASRARLAAHALRYRGAGRDARTAAAADRARVDVMGRRILQLEGEASQARQEAAWGRIAAAASAPKPEPTIILSGRA